MRGLCMCEVQCTRPCDAQTCINFAIGVNVVIGRTLSSWTRPLHLAVADSLNFDLRAIHHSFDQNTSWFRPVRSFPRLWHVRYDLGQHTDGLRKRFGHRLNHLHHNSGQTLGDRREDMFANGIERDAHFQKSRKGHTQARITAESTCITRQLLRPVG